SRSSKRLSIFDCRFSIVDLLGSLQLNRQSTITKSTIDGESLDTVFLELAREHLLSDLEYFSGSRTIAPGLAERLLDLPPLDLANHSLPHLVQRPRQVDLRPGTVVGCGRRQGVPEGQAQMTRVNRVAFGQDDRPLDAVLQLPHVSRPGVHDELLHGR